MKYKVRRRLIITTELSLQFNLPAEVSPPALPPPGRSPEADLHPRGAVRAQGPGAAHQQEAQRGGDGGDDKDDGRHTEGPEGQDREESG